MGKKYKRRAKTGRKLRDRSEWIPVKLIMSYNFCKFMRP